MAKQSWKTPLKEELESDNDFYQALLVSSQSYIAERVSFEEETQGHEFVDFLNVLCRTKSRALNFTLLAASTGP